MHPKTAPARAVDPVSRLPEQPDGAAAERRHVARPCRRPIADAEVQNLQALGAALRAARRSAGLTQAVVARRALIGERHLRDLETGRRRTRRSTLDRLSVALVSKSPAGMPAFQILMILLQAAGSNLAAESPHAARVDRRRARRTRRLVTQQSFVDRRIVSGRLVERRATDVRLDGNRWVRRVRFSRATTPDPSRTVEVVADFAAVPLPPPPSRPMRRFSNGGRRSVRVEPATPPVRSRPRSPQAAVTALRRPSSSLPGTARGPDGQTKVAYAGTPESAG